MPLKDLPADAAVMAQRPLRRWLRVFRFWLVLVTLTWVFLVSLIGLCVLVAPISLLTRNMELAPTVVDVHGSLLRGRATFLGGYRLSWESGAKLLWLPHLATEFVFEGEDTRIIGGIDTGLGGIELRDAKGRAGPNLAVMIPGAWECNMSARINDVSFRWGWRRVTGAGDITTPLGSCTKNGRAQNIPALRLLLGSAGPDALVTLTSDAQLATVLIKRTRRAEITILPSAADIFPQVPRGGPINLQLPF